MDAYLNQSLGFDEVRWATMRKTSYDSRASFDEPPEKRLLPRGTLLYRLTGMVIASVFESPWWMPESTLTELRNDVNRSEHGGGRLLRNYIAEFMALPSADFRVSIVEIRLTNPVYAWVGRSAPLFDRPGGMEQVYLPNLADSGYPWTSDNAVPVRTYWLRF